jgi:hypothetical protein
VLSDPARVKSFKAFSTQLLRATGQLGVSSWLMLRSESAKLNSVYRYVQKVRINVAISMFDYDAHVLDQCNMLQWQKKRREKA